MNVATYQFSEKLLVELFQEGSLFGADFEDRLSVVDGIPQGAIIRDARYQPRHFVGSDDYGVLEILVEHESFDELSDGGDMWGNVRTVSIKRETNPVSA